MENEKQQFGSDLLFCDNVRVQKDCLETRPIQQKCSTASSSLRIG